MVARCAAGFASGVTLRLSVDQDSGLIDCAFTTAHVDEHDHATATALLHAEQPVVDGDAGERGVVRSPGNADAAAEGRVAMRAGTCRTWLDTSEGRLRDLSEPAKAEVHAKVRPPFRVLQQPFSIQKTRLSGTGRNRCKVMWWQR